MDRPKAFLLMPFSGELDWLHSEIIAAGEDAGIEVERADNVFTPGVVIEQIKERIAAASAIVAVCTGRNANVFYELGIAEARHKPILVAEQASDLPFDVQHFRTQFYGPDPASPERQTVRQKISAALTAALQEREAPGAEAPDRIVEDMRQNQELANAPQLCIEKFEAGRFGVENIGRGPALNCRLAHAEYTGDPPRWRSSSTELFRLAPDKQRGPLEYASGSRWHDLILDGLLLQAPESPEGITACVCEDQLGIKRRFVAGRLLQGSSGELRSHDPPPDIWRPGDPETAWVRWY